MSKPMISCDWQNQVVNIHLTHASKTETRIFSSKDVHPFYGINFKCDGVTTTLFLNPEQFHDLYAKILADEDLHNKEDSNE
jgi:hypothetical protein